MRTKGQRAYDAYCEYVGGIAVNGDILPCWEDLPEAVQKGWEYAADEVIETEE